MRYFKNKDILVTGGAGSIGKHLVLELLKHKPKRIRVLDQNENAQFFLQQKLKGYDNVRYIIGDIKDLEKTRTASRGVDIIFHCAALKHVPSCEYNPNSAIQSNIVGLQNMIKASKENKIKKFIYISTDKAVNPQNLMGVTKLLGEKLVNNATVGETDTKFATVRFGNVINSNGSVLQLWRSQIKANEPITITDPEMTRFFMTIQDAVCLVLGVAAKTNGRETHILKMPSIKLMDLAKVISENKQVKIKKIGIRPGEKLYEQLLTEEEAKIANETKNSFVIQQQMLTPHYIKFTKQKFPIKKEKYDSSEAELLTKEEIKKLIYKKSSIPILD